MKNAAAKTTAKPKRIRSDTGMIITFTEEAAIREAVSYYRDVATCIHGETDMVSCGKHKKLVKLLNNILSKFGGF